MSEIRYVSEVGTFMVQQAGAGANSAGSRQLLLGQRLHVEAAGAAGGYVRATDMGGNTGYVEANRLSATQQLKVFYFDVGQGDATLIEAEGSLVIIDGGPNKGFYFEELTKRLQQKQVADLAAGLPVAQRLRFDSVIVTHFDRDHFYGLIKVLEAVEFEIGHLYHSGIARYASGANKDLDLGDLIAHNDGTRSVSADLRGIASARALLASGDLLTENGNDNQFAQFLRAAVGAYDAGRLGGMSRLVRRDPAGAPVHLQNTGALTFEVLAPISTRPTGSLRLPAFHDPHDVTPANPDPAPSASHTINGNSVVLRLDYGGSRFLFGGDLNQPAQRYLADKYGSHDPFRADVNKACHHGSSDFELEFVEGIEPHATVFSSGDNGSYDHPMPDAMGTAAKHSRGSYPLVFSTELARETSSSGTKLGHINARCNGATIVMAQKKERPGKKPWHTFQLPYAGPFTDHD